MEPLALFGSYLSALFIIAIYSFVFKDNPVYRFGEVSFFGVSMGYIIMMSIKNILEIGVIPLSQGSYLRLFPMILGMMLFAVYWRKFVWITWYPMALMVGVTTGLFLRGRVSSSLINLSKTFLVPNTFNNVVIVVSVLMALQYFLFTVERKGPLKTLQTIGRYFIMARMGATYGNMIMYRTTLGSGGFLNILRYLGLIS